MLHVALYEPEIPPNTGNIIRLCANTGFKLHLIEPLGFPLDDKKMKRAGLDYHELMNMTVHQNYEAFLECMKGSRIIACETHGTQTHSDFQYQAGDVLLFGPETRGLPDYVCDAISVENTVRIPMRPDSRSLNLSNSVAIVVYECWRQLGFVIDNF